MSSVLQNNVKKLEKLIGPKLIIKTSIGRDGITIVKKPVTRFDGFSFVMGVDPGQLQSNVPEAYIESILEQLRGMGYEV